MCSLAPAGLAGGLHVWSSHGFAAFDDHTFVRGELDNIAADAVLSARIGAEEDLPAREVGG